MFEGFEVGTEHLDGIAIHYRIGGNGPPLLLLHGYPQTHVMWHRVAPVLARTHTVVCPDLRGYGDSGKPPSDALHLAYSKRSSAADMVALMERLGFARFAVAGHDRGGRVTHRMCLDHPQRISRAAVLDIVPTRTLYAATSKAVATGYFHWFFLIQPDPVPETLIGGAPDFWLDRLLGAWSRGGASPIVPEAMAAYRRAFRDPATIHATCEDYRAAASIDLVHDEADAQARIACPLLVLWGEHGLMHRHFDVLATWREKAAGPVEGAALPCGHFLPEEAPAETTAALERFFAAG
ncbi:MAG: alpha/beta hydrolase [Geminicoccaceae bacterium]